jgi:hypothetical protein
LNFLQRPRCKNDSFTPCIFLHFYVNNKSYKKIVNGLQWGIALLWVITQRVVVILQYVWWLFGTNFLLCRSPVRPLK